MPPLSELLGESPGIGAVREKIDRLLQHQSGSRRLPPILIHGETGTGKGLLARAIHRAGPRAAGPFVDVNCAAIPETLLEAELFGFERGAFTDARQAKLGLFQVANRGTIFLDEIGLLPEGLQAKILTAIEERAVRRLGSTQRESVDVWILAATSVELAAAVRERRFREDLYHRLAVLPLWLPPLRERGRDILLLADHFLASTCADYELPPKTFAPDARAALLAYRWPGNIRELGNVIERVTLLSEGALVTAALLGLQEAPIVETPAASQATIPLEDRVGDAERAYLLEALRETGWNISRAAARLRVSRNTLRYRIEKHGLSPEGSPAPPRRKAERAPRAVPEPAAAPQELGALAAFRWEPGRLTLLRAALVMAAERDFAADASRALKVVVEKVQSFGGRLEELSQTEVVAAFGLEPVEDAPRRAVHAAMAIQKAQERDQRDGTGGPRIRVGIHVGQFMVGRIGGTSEIELTAKRSAWMVLDELIRRAEPDDILVSEAAVPFLERRFDLVPVLPGESRAFRLAGRERAGLGLWGRMVKFVGRGHELELLQSRWAAAVGGHGQVVGIVGEAGIGKSRLLFEFRQNLAAEGVAYLEAGCLSYGNVIPYFPVLHLLKAYFRIEEPDDSGAVREKVTAKVATLDEALGELIPAFLALLEALPDDHPFLILDPPQRRVRTLEAIKLLLLMESQVQPLLVVIEDLHWIDSETQAILDELVESLPASRLLLLVTYRPEYQHGWGRKTYYTQLSLAPLPSTSAGELFDALLGDDPSLAPLKQVLIERTEGNPFFLEESLWTLVESGVLVADGGTYRLARPVASIEVPATVQAVLAARIDRLPPEQKHLLQAGSVIGKDIPFVLIEAVAGLSEEPLRHGLARLQAAEFLYEARLFPRLEYTFKHTLTHEVAYGTLDQESRKALHAKTVEALEQIYGERVTEQAEALARHALLGEIWEKAVDYLREAGAKAYARAALVETLDRYEQARALIARLPTSADNARRAIDVRLDLHAPLLAVGQIPRLLQLYEEAEPLARQLNDPRRLGRVLYRIGQCSWLDARYRDGMEHARQALDIATPIDDPEVRVLATYALGLCHQALGEYRAAIDLFGRVVDGAEAELAKRLLAVTVSAYIASGCWLAYCLALVGDFERALAYGQRVLGAAEASDHPQAQAITYTFLAITLAYRGEFAQARPWCERAVSLCETKGLLVWLPVAYFTLGWALAGAGLVAEGLPYLERAATLHESMGVKTNLSQRYVRWAEGLLLAGRIEEARGVADRAVELAVTAGERGNEAEALHVRGRVAAAETPPALASAQGSYGRAKALAEELGMRPLLARCHLDLGQLAQRGGSRSSAQEHFERAAGLFREMEMPFWAAQAEAAR